MVKNLPANVGDAGLIPASERFPEEGNGNPLKYSCLGNPMDRGAWRGTVHVVTKESHKSEATRTITGNYTQYLVITSNGK